MNSHARVQKRVEVAYMSHAIYIHIFLSDQGQTVDRRGKRHGK